MSLSVIVSELKAHAAAYVASLGHIVDGPLHSTLNAFAAFVEGKAIEKEAVSYLTGKGYTVTPPPAVTPPSAPVPQATLQSTAS